MDKDYVTDQKEENQILRDRVAELEQEISEARKDLTTSLERKIQETDEGVPPEDVSAWNVTKKERKDEEFDPSIPLGAAENEEPNPSGGRIPNLNFRPSQRKPAREQDDIIIVDSEEDLPRSQESSTKRKSEGRPRDFRPAKRQAVWVEVPPRSRRVSSVPVKQEPSDEGQTVVGASVPAQGTNQGSPGAVSIPRNTKLKLDKKALDDVSVFTRLSKVGLEIFPITIGDQIKEFSVSRQHFLAPHFGGSPVEAYPRISKKNLEKHGFDNFMYVSLSLHPNAPSFPGAPGLWMCACGGCPDTMEDMRLLVRVQTKPKALWQYMGQYDIRTSDPLSLQEWAMQSNQTKTAWAEYLLGKGWGYYVRARIVLRRQLGREPTKEEVDEFSGDQNVTSADILEALDRGDERLRTWTLKCRGYDERFQMEIWTAASPGATIKSEDKSDNGDDGPRLPRRKKRSGLGLGR